MKKGSILKRKIMMKITSIVTVLLVTIILISSSSISSTINNKSKIKKYYFEDFSKDRLDGLAPRNINNVDKSSINNNDKQSLQISQKSDIMYGYCAYDPSGQLEEGPIKFCIDDPGTLEQIASTQSDNFIAGGTWTCDEEWLGVQYNNGLLWQIDPETGDMCSIGGGGVGLNGCSWDPAWGRLYGVSSTALYKIDPDTGEQDLIGQLGIPNSAICIVIDLDGTAWLWDILLSGDATLYTCDLESGTCTEHCSIGENLMYAQDGDYDKDTGILWFTAYSSTGFLAYFDFDAEELVHVDDFQGGAEITGSIFNECWWGPEHDVALKSIDYPESGYAIQDIPMQVTVKNHGNNKETTDVQMQVIKYESGPIIMQEDFSSVFPPEGWETDYWNTSNTNISGGKAPEAQVYNYDQYNGSQYYDNYIMSGPINCTGLEKVNIKFRWAGDYKYPQYASAYVYFRRNSTSPWKDVTPWDNPVSSNQDAKLWETSCYSLDNPMGEDFQIKWVYIGYYNYFNYLWLDDIEIIAYNKFEEYDETVEDIEIKYGETVTVEFPKWTPNDWQDPIYENTYQEYKVKACTLLKDHKPSNDCKNKIINLYFPWFHDIEVKSIDSPCEDGHGKTYPVQATIKNVGQYAENSISTDMKISEPIILGNILIENFSSGQCPPSGWTDEHKTIEDYYGWRISNTTNSGGTIPEAYVPYTYCRADYHFYSYPLDTSDYPICRLEFKSYINHYTGHGLYALEAGYSFDAENWYTAWHEEPGSNGGYEVDVPIEGGSETTYIGFWVKGNPYYFNYWYLDDIVVKAIGTSDEEYSDSAYQQSDIEPGEEITFTFEDWTPAFLAEKTTGSKDYIIGCTIECESDNNPDNDIKTEEFTLDYWHDAGIDRITSPVGEGNPRAGESEIWDNGLPDGRNALPGSMYQGYSNILIDDFEAESDWTIQGGKLHYVWDSGYSSNLEKINFYIFEDLGGCNPSEEEYPEEGYYVEANTFDEYTTGDYYFGRPECVADFLLDEEFEISAGKYYVGIQLDGINENIVYILTAESKGCEIMADLPYWGYPRWSSSSYLWGAEYDLSFNLEGTTGGAPAVKAWIQPGTQDIASVVKNYGTFTKEDLTCYAQIWEYITDPENGTEVWTDEIGNIDLMEPLGGEENLQFADFTFAEEGRYGLFMQLPTEPDDEQKNNQIRWGVWVDDTRPKSDYPPILYPEEPDGENGWYVSDVIVTLNANDPWSNGVSSGVKEIRYTINGGAEQVIPGKTGSFVITQDGDDIEVEYWAIDWVGNEESPHNTFTIDMDQTVPEISLNYDVTGGSNFTGWEFTFRAEVADIMSGINRVEFYLNGLLQKTVYGSESEYLWVVKLPKGIYCIIKAIAYDNAGNYNSDEIENPKISGKSVPKTNYFKYLFNIIFKDFLERFPIIQKIIDRICYLIE